MIATMETLNDLDAPTKSAVIDLLYRLADDAIIIGHRGSEWTGFAPILEEDIAFSSMAQDDMGHALTFYQMLHELGEPDPDTNVFGRKLEQWKCASLVSLCSKRDWAKSLVRKYFYDVAESLRLESLAQGSLVPLAQLARKLSSEKKYHLMHGHMWMPRLGQGTDESHQLMQDAVDTLYPHALGMFESTGADDLLDQAGIFLREDELRKRWVAAVDKVLGESSLKINAKASPVYGGRSGKHPDDLATLLDGMQLVYKLDPSAKW